MFLVESKLIVTCFAQVQGLNEAVQRYKTDGDMQLRETTIAGKAAKQAYFLQKGMELSTKKKEAEKKKEKYLAGGGGLKYTALAMASRD